MSVRQLTLVVPGLLSPAGDDNPPEKNSDYPSVPALELLLSRASVQPAAAPTHEHNLFALFGADIGPDTDTPQAAASRCHDSGEIHTGWWLRADPVHVQPGIDSVIMFGNRQLSVSEQEAEQLATELNRHFVDDGWQLEVHNSHRWYLHLPTTPSLMTHDLHAVIGRDIHSFLPAGKDSKQWHGLLNEVQMVLHASPVNEAREQRDEPLINSLWFWGGGTLPELPAQTWQGVWSDDPVSCGLAKAAGIPCEALPVSADDWFDGLTQEGEFLIVMTEARDAIAYGESQGWREFIERLDQVWGKALQQALKSGELSKLSVYPGNGFVYHIDGRGVRRWWKRPRSLSLL